MKYELSGKITDDYSGVKFNKGDYAKALFEKIKDKPMLITINILRKNRSHNQNRWLWGVAYPIIIDWTEENFGEKYTKDEIHAYICASILGLKYEVKEMMGVEVLIAKDSKTSSMSTTEFIDAKEKIQRFYAQKGLNIPDPTEHSLREDYYR